MILSDNVLPALTFDDLVLMAQNTNPEYTSLRAEVRKLLNARWQEAWGQFVEHEADIYREAFPERYKEECVYHGKHVYDLDDFPGIGALEVGDLVNEEVVQDLMDTLPPTHYSNWLAQVGEPYDHVLSKDGHMMPIFATFKRLAPAAVWEFCGNCPEGYNPDREKQPGSKEVAP